MSLKTWWQRKSGPSKLVTALTALLIVQMGLCFASPGEPAWFDKLFHIKPGQFGLRVGLVVVEAYLCVGTFILLLIALMAWAVASWRKDKPAVLTLSERTKSANRTSQHDSGDSPHD